MSWDKDPLGFIDDVELEVKKEKAKVALYVLQGLVTSSPVDTGRYRGNHQISLTYPIQGYNWETKDKDGPKTQSEGLRKISTATPFETIHLQNNLPYAGDIEDGTSPQAETGVYKVVFESAKRKFN